MVTEFKFPDVGEGVTEGTLIKWLVSEGDEVEEDESLAEVETDKAVVEVPSPEHATILKLHADEGEVINVGEVLVTLGEEGEDAAASSSTATSDDEPVGEEASETATEEPDLSDMTVDEVKEQVDSGDITAEAAIAAEKNGKERTTLIGWLEDRIDMETDDAASTSVVGRLEDADHPTEEASTQEESEPAGQVRAAPSVRKLARENGIDITAIGGSGPGGRVTRNDVLQAEGSGAEASGTQPATDTGRVLATPATRRLAREHDIDIRTIEGSGPGGRVTREDVLQAAEGGAEAGEHEAPAPTEASTAEEASVGVAGGLGTPNRFPPKKYDFEEYGEVEREEMSGVRKAIAKNMERSKYTAPHVTATDDADVTELWDVRDKEKEVAESRGIHLTFLPFIVKSCIAAMREFPLMNASLDETTGEIVKKKYYNIGIAVATEYGLVVPNIKNADRKSILKIAKEMNELAGKARDHKLSMDDMQGGTFTITNYGSIGGKYGTPILNYPEVAILGTGTISKEPIVKNGDIHIRRMLPLSVTFDHRVIDGAYVAQFMNELIKHLEDPDLLLLDE